MWLDVRPQQRLRGRPGHKDKGTGTVGLDLAPYPRGVPDPWRNRVACHLFWWQAGGAVISIATARVQGGELPEHRVQHVASLNTYKLRTPVVYAEGDRSIPRSAVDTDWTVGLDIETELCRLTSEVAAHACRTELRLRMLDWVGRGIHEEVPTHE